MKNQIPSEAELYGMYPAYGVLGTGDGRTEVQKETSRDERRLEARAEGGIQAHYQQHLNSRHPKTGSVESW